MYQPALCSLWRHCYYCYLELKISWTLFWFHNAANTICSFPGFLFSGRRDKQHGDRKQDWCRIKANVSSDSSGWGRCLCTDALSLVEVVKLSQWCRTTSQKAAETLRLSAAVRKMPHLAAQDVCFLSPSGLGSRLKTRRFPQHKLRPLWRI